MKHLAVVIDWYGPYQSAEEAKKAAKIDFDSGLYVGLGKCRGQHIIQMQYIGISKKLGTRGFEEHHKLVNINRDYQLWLGEVCTADVGGRKVKCTSQQIDTAEWVHAFFLNLPLNERKKKSPPDRTATVLNRWWKKDYETPYIRRPHKSWPDLLDYLGPDYYTRIVWFGQKQKRISPPHNI